MKAVKRRVSFAELQRMPEDGKRYELYDGGLRVAPSPLLKHQIIAVRLTESFLAFRRRAGGSVLTPPLDIVLCDYDVVQPDLMYFGPLRAQRLRPNEYVRVAPDLVVEIVSPSTEQIDRGPKRELYAKHRVREYWIVDPQERRIDVSLLKSGRYGEPLVVKASTLTSPTFADLAIDLGDLFCDLD